MKKKISFSLKELLETYSFADKLLVFLLYKEINGSTGHVLGGNVNTNFL